MNCAICGYAIWEDEEWESDDGAPCHTDCLDYEAEGFYYEDENGAW